MRKWALRCLLAFLTLTPALSKATHIIGGEITYTHLGGDAYQVTLRLFRDCGPSSIGFPALVQVRAWYNNGANFVPIDIPFLGQNIVPPLIDSCVVNPNVCVEEASYAQVAILPQVPGGYHITYQTCCRNGTVLNVINPLGVGAAYHTHIPEDTITTAPPPTPTIWLEDFNLPNFTTVDNGPTAWQRFQPLQCDWAEVRNQVFECRDTDGEVQWFSEWVNISAYPAGVNLEVDISEQGTQEFDDSIRVYYSVNNGPLTLFPINGAFGDDFAATTAEAHCIAGDSIRVWIEVENNSDFETHFFDNVHIRECSQPKIIPIGNNSSPRWKNMPPIFLCQNDTFTFDHSAIDPDGDSLAYKVCDPYNSWGGGANNPPPFLNNWPQFTSVPWLGTYNKFNPLGPPNLRIDSVTGIITGFPQTPGQFVVGICVEEWIGDSLVNEVRRDFQFNIVPCPPIAVAGIDTIDGIISVCNGTAVAFSNHTNPLGAPTEWDFGDLSTNTDTSTQLFPTYTYPDTGRYTVRMITNPNTNCADTAYATVYVGYVIAGFTSNSPVCIGSAMNFVDTSRSSNNGVVNNWSWDFGDGSPLDTNQNPSHTYGNPGQYTVKLIVGNDIGCIDSFQTTVTVDSLVVVNAGNDTSVCATLTPFQLNGSSSTGAGSWTSSGTGTFLPSANVLNPTYTPTSADTTAGSVMLILRSAANGACPANQDTLILTFIPLPFANAGTNINVCATTTTIPLNGSVGNATGGTWITSGTGTFSPNPNVLNPTYNVTPADTTAGTITLSLITTGNLGGCDSDTSTITVTFTPDPVAFAGRDTTLCANNGVLPLAGNSNTGSGVWSTSGTGSFAPSTTVLNPTYTPSSADTAAGSVVLTFISTNNGICPADTHQITITYTDAPASFPGADDTICANNPVYNLNGAVWNAGGGTWITSGTGTFTPNPNILNPTYNASPADTVAGSVVLSLITTGNGICLPDTQSLTLTILNSPWVSAGPDFTHCLTTFNIPLNGSSSTGTATWTTLGSGSFVPNPNILNPNYVPSNADTAAGFVDLVITTTGQGICLPESDTVRVTLIPLQIVDAGNDTTMCANNAVLPLNGAVWNGPPFGKWSTSGSGTFTPHDSSLTASYIPSAGDTTAGGYTIYLTSSRGCAAVLDSIVVTLTPAPFVNAGPDQTLCNNNPNATLSGIVSGGSSTGTWSTPNGTGAFVPGPNNLNTTYQPSPADTVAGSVTIVLTSTNNGKCLAVTDTLVLTFVTQPTALAGPDQTICANDSAQLAGAIINGAGTGIWTSSGTGTFNPGATTPNAFYIPSPADTASGSVRLIWTSTNNGNCNPVMDTMFITIIPSPYANAGRDTAICANNATVQLNGVIWNATGGAWVTTGTGTFSPNNTALNATYTASPADTVAGFVDIILKSTGNGLCDTVCDTMRITITGAPIVNAGLDIFLCEGDMTALLNGSVTNGATTGQWSTLGSGTFTPNNTTLNATYNLSTADTAAGGVRLVLTSTGNGNCAAVTDTVDIIITPVPSVNAGNDTSVCSSIDSVGLNGIVTGGLGQGYWVTTGSGTFTPNDTLNNPYYHPSSADTSAGSVKIYFYPVGACRPVVDSITITFQAAPFVNAGTDYNICWGDTIALNGTMFNGSGNKWVTTGTGTFIPHDSIINTQYVPDSTDLANGFVEFVLTTNGLALCPGSTDTIRVNIGDVPIANFWNDGICEGQTIQLIDTSTIGFGNLTFWQYIIGTDTMNVEDTTYTVGAAGTISITHIVSGQYGCSDTITKTLNINPNPVALFGWDAWCSDSVAFTDSSSGNIASWIWSFGDTTSGDTVQHPMHWYSRDSAFYIATLTVITDSGCSHTYADTIYLLTGPTADYIPQGGTYNEDDPIAFTNQSIGGSTYFWDFRDGNTSTDKDPTHTFTDPGTYLVLLVVTDTNGCTDTVSYLFTILDIDDGPVAVPSGFTPNGDGENDFLYVRGGPVINLRFTIYNEWGNKIWETTNQKDGWNGKYRGQPQPNGTYVYTVKGELKNGDVIDFVGETNILR